MKCVNKIYDRAYFQHSYMFCPRASEVKWKKARCWLAGVASWEAWPSWT